MDKTYPQPIVNILRAINFGDLSSDVNEFRRTMLDVVSKNLRLDRALFILADDSSKFTNFMVKNIDEVWVRKYKDYYHFHDPFELLDGSYRNKRVLRLDQIVKLPSFFKSEYCNEFLSPQQVHHKVTTHLIYGEKAVGVFGFFRSKKSPGFSKEEIDVISTIAPFITHALIHIDINARQKIQSTILDIVKDNNADGLLIFDDSMKLVYMNENARRVCAEFQGISVEKDCPSSDQGPHLLLDHCKALVKEHRGYLSLKPTGPEYRQIQSKNKDKIYVISSRRIRDRIFPDNYCLYAVTIDEIRDPLCLPWERFKQLYDLTSRQVDILSLLYKGFANAEISRQLSIREITVKKHLQNMFEKFGVRNRTALLHRMLVGSYGLN